MAADWAAGEGLRAKWIPRSIPIAARIRNTSHPKRLGPLLLGFGGTSEGAERRHARRRRENWRRRATSFGNASETLTGRHLGNHDLGIVKTNKLHGRLS